MSKNAWKVAAAVGGAVAGLAAIAVGAKKAIDYYKSSQEEEEPLMQPNDGPTISNEVVDRPEVEAYQDRNEYEYGESPYNPYVQPVAPTSTNVESSEDEAE